MVHDLQQRFGFLTTERDRDVLISHRYLELVVSLLDRGFARRAALRNFEGLADLRRFRVADHHLMVLLSVHPDLFGALLVFEMPLVVALAALARIRLDAGNRLLVRQVIGRLIFIIVDGTDDERPVGVTIEEFYDGFL